MNPAIKREISRIERLGEKVEVNENSIVIHITIVPAYIGEAFAERIRKADLDKKYNVIVLS